MSQKISINDGLLNIRHDKDSQEWRSEAYVEGKESYPVYTNRKIFTAIKLKASEKQRQLEAKDKMALTYDPVYIILKMMIVNVYRLHQRGD